MSGLVIGAVLYAMCGLVTAVVVTKRSKVDMTDLVFLPFLGWPAWWFAETIAFIVRVCIRGLKR